MMHRFSFIRGFVPGLLKTQPHFLTGRPKASMKIFHYIIHDNNVDVEDKAEACLRFRGKLNFARVYKRALKKLGRAMIDFILKVKSQAENSRNNPG